LLLLEEQDRSRFDQRRIEVGLEWLATSARGNHFSRYHAEAGIAAEHCLAPSFEATRWDRVAQCYSLLERVAPSPLHRLNRAVAVAEGQGAERGLAILDGFEPPVWLEKSYQWSAVLSDLNRRAGKLDLATRYRELALDAAPTSAIEALLRRRLAVEP
jgi:RNA polymerase sigma-70 factor (ECF subfamily)